MKYILTNQWIEITEKEGALPNNSVLYPILLAAATTWPDINTPYKAVSSGETQNFKAAENEKMYLRLFTNDNNAAFEVSVVTFIPEQIQNLSHPLPSGTILAVDYRKGVTAQDENGKLIESNGIETILGHDTGVFYNADGYFQGQRDRVKGLWAGKGTVNLAKEITTGAFITSTTKIEKDGYSNFKGTKTQGSLILNVGIDSGSIIDDKYHIYTKIRNNGLSAISFSTNNLTVPGGSILAGETKVIDDVYTAFATAGAAYQIRMTDNTDYNIDIWDEIMYEKSPIATPFCEKNRGDYQMSYPCDLDLRTDAGFLIFEFEGKCLRGVWAADIWEFLALHDAGNNIYISESKIDVVNDNIIEGMNRIVIPNLSQSAPVFLNGVQVTTTTTVSNAEPSGIVTFFGRRRSSSSQYKPNNFLKKAILGKGRSLTAEEIALYSDGDIEIPDVGEFYPVAYSKKRTDENGISRNFYEVMELDDDIRAVKAGEIIKVQGADLTEYLAKIEDNLAITGVEVIDVSDYIRLDAGVALPAKVWVMK